MEDELMIVHATPSHLAMVISRKWACTGRSSSQGHGSCLAQCLHYQSPSPVGKKLLTGFDSCLCPVEGHIVLVTITPQVCAINLIPIRYTGFILSLLE
jgi:hypothetical protein